MSTNQSLDLDDLYQEIILDHFRHPRNQSVLSEEEAMVSEENPTCGDQIRLSTNVEDGRVAAIRYQANGCAISVASSSMMSEILTGKSVEEAKEIIRKFVEIMTGKQPMDSNLGDVIALEGVKNYPLRIKCATMSWHAMEHALQQ